MLSSGRQLIRKNWDPRIYAQEHLVSTLKRSEDKLHRFHPEEARLWK